VAVVAAGSGGRFRKSAEWEKTRTQYHILYSELIKKMAQGATSRGNRKQERKGNNTFFRNVSVKHCFVASP
jgi:hypothetical protein